MLSKLEGEFLQNWVVFVAWKLNGRIASDVFKHVTEDMLRSQFTVAISLSTVAT